MNNAVPVRCRITVEMRQIWTLLRSKGGWWTEERLAVHWKPTFARQDMQEALDMLEAGRFITSQDHTTNLVYGFTSDCRLLPDQDSLRPVGPSRGDVT